MNIPKDPKNGATKLTFVRCPRFSSTEEHDQHTAKIHQDVNTGGKTAIVCCESAYLQISNTGSFIK